MADLNHPIREWGTLLQSHARPLAKSLSEEGY
jgi:hypothetical protein